MRATKKNLTIKTLQHNIERLQDFEECVDLIFHSFKKHIKKTLGDLQTLLNQITDK